MEKHCFRLKDEFVEQYSTRKAPFTDIGLITYYRTYSRTKEDGSSEEWFETVRRVVEGSFSIQKNHCNVNRLPWSEKKAQNSAEKMYDLIFNLKFTPPGRGLWMMGSDYMYTRWNSSSLQNCAFCSTEYISTDFSEPFVFMMDMSMLGVGVGFDTKGADKVTIKKPKYSDDIHVVADTREGWVELLKRLLDSFDGKNTLPKEVDYSQVRPLGAPLKGFGGTSSGPQPLIDMYDDILKILEANVGNKITVTMIVDIMNLIGRCVVSGNIRRSAQISFGDPQSEEFINLKNPELFSEELTHHRWASNNSVFAEVGMDYTKVAELTAKNGEPGYAWLDNMRKYSRMNGTVDNKDYRVAGGNPCLAKGTMVQVVGEGPVPIEDLAERDEPFHVYSMSKDGKLSINKAHAFLSKTNAETLKLSFATGKEIICTPDHKIAVDKSKNGSDPVWVEAKDLQIGDSGVAFQRIKKGYGYLRVKLSTENTYEPEHRKVYSYFNNIKYDVKDNHVHHKDDNPFNNHPDNLEMLSSSEHGKITNLGHKNYATQDELGRFNGSAKEPIWNTSKEAPEHLLTKNIPGGSVRIKSIEEGPISDVYDLSVENDHCFIANDIVVHNCLEQSLEHMELCLVGDTKILTSDGYKDIGSMSGNTVDVAVTYDNDENLTENKRFEQANVFYSGEKQTLKISTVGGREITSTLNHPHLIERDGESLWVEAKDVETGDALIDGSQEIATNKPTLDKKFYALGHFLGDGWFLNTNGKKHIGVCAGSDERDLLTALVPVWEDLKEEASPYIESVYDDRYDSSISITEGSTGVLSFNITKPQVHRLLENKYGFKYGTAPTKRLPSSYWDATVDEKRSFLRGLFDADGYVKTSPRYTVTLTTANEDLAKDVSLALSEFGIVSRLTTHYIESRNRSQTILNIRGKDMLELFHKHVLFQNEDFYSRKANNLRIVCENNAKGRNASRKFVVSTIEEGDIVPVFNMEVKNGRHYTANGLVTHNCNLVETYPSNHDSLNDWIETLKYAYLYAKSVTLMPTHNHKSNAVMFRNRRIGCSISGITQAFSKFGRRNTFDAMSGGYDSIQVWDRTYSDWLGIPRSIKTTSIKPSGTVSLLANVTPGIHYPLAEYYIRRIRFQSDSKLLKKLKEVGYKTEKDKYSLNTTNVLIPIKQKFFDRSASEVSMWEQLEIAAQIQEFWADNQVSATITFANGESKDIAKALELYETRLKGISFLPLVEHSYEQPPYEPIDEKTYNKMVLKLAEMNKIEGTENEIIEKFCDGESCLL